MALSAAFYIEKALLGLRDPKDEAFNAALESALQAAWFAYEEAGVSNLRLRAAYAKRDAIDFLLERYWREVDAEGGAPGGTIVYRNSQRFQHLERLRDRAAVELKAIERATAGGATRATAITTTTAIAAPDGATVDASGRRYRGDAYYRMSRPR